MKPSKALNEIVIVELCAIENAATDLSQIATNLELKGGDKAMEIALDHCSGEILKAVRRIHKLWHKTQKKKKH